MRFASLICVFATLVALAVGCLFALPAAAKALAETGQITSPASGTALTTGKPVTVKATVTDACKATLTLRTPAGDKTNLVTENGNSTCLGDISLAGTFTPDAPGTYTVTLSGSVPLGEATLTATDAPTPNPTVTVTATATPTATATGSATPTPTPTATVTKTAKPTATPTKTVTAKPTATPTKTVTAKPTATATVKVTEPAPAANQQPAAPYYAPAVPTTTPSGTDTDKATEPAPAAPVTTVTAQPDYMAMWLAMQNMSATSKTEDGSIWDAILRVIGILAILGGIGSAAWIGFRTFRKRGNHHSDGH
ncbi:hypothetical protein [Nonomuraea bangladeshensis]|uniref:hypothetical protein n=1 Tax=Nonomuraea bangladeshensis TaxID=404385 RepID=UPI003C2B882D